MRCLVGFCCWSDGVKSYLGRSGLGNRKFRNDLNEFELLERLECDL